MVWAFHSESQELLVGACVNACGGKISWADARALGIPLWLNSIESLVRIWFILRPRLKRCKFFCRKLRWRSLRGTNTWLERTGIL